MKRVTWIPFALVALAACGGGNSNPGSADAALADARGADAASVDAVPVDAGPTVDASGPDAPPLTGNLLTDLRAIPGLTVTDQGTTGGGYHVYSLKYLQPVDHHDPDGPTFSQRMTLLSRDLAAPVVVYTHGYDMNPESVGRYEPTQIVNGNQLAIEHRFFGTSFPSPKDWTKLDIWQAANDHHRIVSRLRSIYPGKWLATGASKDGMTAVYFRRFFPADIDGTIAYVAPLSFGGPDPRYIDFVEQAGPDANCRARLVTFQRTVLGRRANLTSRMDSSWDFDILGLDVAFEHVTLELPFGFWQYKAVALCSSIPDANDGDDEVYAFLNGVGQISAYADDDVSTYYGYYYQAAAQLGWPQINEAHVSELIEHPGTDGAPAYSPQPVTFDPTVMIDIDTWVRNEGKSLMFIYGGYDPWTAGAFTLGNATDSFKYTVPTGNHGATINQLPEAMRGEARATIRRWAGVSVGAKPIPEPTDPPADERARRRPL